MEMDELRMLLDENSINLDDMNDVLSVAYCSSCCASGGGGVSN